MKKTIYLLMANAFLCSCSVSKTKKGKEDKQYYIAYNIHENDTIHKNNYEVITMNMDGTNKKKHHQSSGCCLDILCL